MLTSKMRTKIRQHFGLGKTTSIPVYTIECNQEPVLLGENGGWFTRGGTPIRHPSAYSKVGWSNMMYCCSTRKIVVGTTWVKQNV